MLLTAPIVSLPAVVVDAKRRLDDRTMASRPWLAPAGEAHTGVPARSGSDRWYSHARGPPVIFPRLL